MVPPLQNDLVNGRSRLHNDRYAEMSPGQQLTEILRYHEESIHDIQRNQIDVNAFGDEPVLGTVTVNNPIRQPLMLTDILATWATNNPAQSNSQSATGTQVTPAAGTLIAGVSVSAGIYLVEWGVEILTAAATVPDNMRIAINGGASNLALSINGTAIGSYPNQMNANAVVQATSEIGIYSVAAEATGTYKGTVTITLLSTITTPPSANITLGGRTFQCNYESGLFVASSLHGIQLDNTGANSKAVLTVSPAAACHLEICGYADYRKNDRE